MSTFPSNQARKALQDGHTIIGTMLAEIRQPAIMQLLVNAGFDFVIIDNEHGPFSVETIAELSRTARNLGLTPIVRVPDLAYPYLAQSLDGGAQGIMLPRVYDGEQVRRAVEITKYPPMGMRGCAFGRGHTDFQAMSLSETMAIANAGNMLVIQIETQEAVDNLDEILSVPGVDAAFVGPTDLSIALGVPGQTDSPVLISAIDKVLDACRRHDVYPALQMNDLALAMEWSRKGMRMISSMSETALLVSAGAQVTSTIRSVDSET